MGFWDKVKSFLGLENREVKALPPAQMERQTTCNQTVKLARPDGSFIQITPNFDRTKTQMLKEISKINGETVYVPSYSIQGDELGEYMFRGSTIANIYMEIDFQRLLSDASYKKYVEEMFLSPGSLKVALQFGGYVGKIMEDEKGFFTYCDPDITKGAEAGRVQSSREARRTQEISTQQQFAQQRKHAMGKKDIPSTGPHTGPLIEDDYEL